MRHEVFVKFAHEREFALLVTAHDPTMASDEARRWLDDQFVANECEPLRPSGKVLTADKLLALASAVGPERFESDPDWAATYARATLAALGRPMVQVDVGTRAVTF
jgi:hypothetical protein